MEKSQYKLCIEVLHRLEGAGVLKEVILIGSWCAPFYKEYFSGTTYAPHIRTRDIDFLVPAPASIRAVANIPVLLKDLGFIINFQGEKGYIRLEHPDLVVEFLVPEKGKGIDKPYPLPKFGLNAVALRFLDLLTDDVIKVKIEDIELNLPHPANFALHKLIIFQRRQREDKSAKDRDSAIEILKALIDKGEASIIKKIFHSIHPSWQKKIIVGLEKVNEKEIITILRG